MGSPHPSFLPSAAMKFFAYSIYPIVPNQNTSPLYYSLPGYTYKPIHILPALSLPSLAVPHAPNSGSSTASFSQLISAPGPSSSPPGRRGGLINGSLQIEVDLISALRQQDVRTFTAETRSSD